MSDPAYVYRVCSVDTCRRTVRIKPEDDFQRQVFEEVAVIVCPVCNPVSRWEVVE